ncbi:hypothetical protein FKM82_028687 [Ascaphus truei]
MQKCFRSLIKMAAPIRLGYNFVLITATWGLQQRLLYEPLGSGRGAFRHGLDYGSDTAVGDVITVSAPSGGRARPRRARLDAPPRRGPSIL